MTTIDTEPTQLQRAPAERSNAALDLLRDSSQLLRAIPDDLLWLDVLDDGIDIIGVRPQDVALAAATLEDRAEGSLYRSLRSELAIAIDSGRTRAFRHSDRCPDSVRHLDIRIVPGEGRQGLAVVREVSDQYRLESELQQAQRLEAIGRLAGGIAHEINTPIQFIGDNVRFLQQSFAATVALVETYRSCLFGEEDVSRWERTERARRAEEEADVEFLVEEVPAAARDTLDGVERVATIVKAMKTFGRAPRREQAPANLNAALANAIIVSRSEHKHVADVVADFGDIPPVMCNIGGISQVFLNLIVNSAHAIAEKLDGGDGRGCITISTSVDGDDVVVEVTDDGCGIPADIIAKVFDPMFTTKEVGRGTGQGLSLSRGIVVDQHGGTLTARSEVGEGSTFRLTLPIDGVPDRRR